MPYRTLTNEDAFPVTFDFTGEDAIIQNAQWRREFLLVDVAVDGTETPFDLEGWLVYMQVKADYDGAVLLDLNTYNGRAGIGNFGSGDDLYSIWLELGADDTVDLEPFGRALFDIFAYDLSLRKHRIFEGHVTLSRNVST